MEKKELINKITDFSSDLMEKHFPKEECKELWGIEPDDDSPAVCDDCWEKIHPSKHVDLYRQAREIVKKTGKLN